MALNGDAFLVMWHDIVAEAQDEYMEWHTREHMPERLSVPGFLTGKRLINHEIDHYRYGTVYSGRNLEVFRSPAYLARLNNPTPWAVSLQPMYRNFLRVACERIAKAGTGDGGAMATIRLDFEGAEGVEGFARDAQPPADTLAKVTSVCAVHIGLSRAEVSSQRTRETELRPDMAEKNFDAVVLLEGSGRPELTKRIAEVESSITAASQVPLRLTSQVYDLAYHLTAEQTAMT